MYGYSSGRSICAMALAALMVIFGAASCGRPEAEDAENHCAIMSDSVGLYVGNPVTTMGYPIGVIKAVEPRALDVKVVFTINRGEHVPADVKAVTRSPSILADRALELVGNYSGGPQLKPAECIPLSRTSTPMSISKTIGSATDFVNAVNPKGSTNLQDSLRGIDEALTGNGVSANELLTRSSQLLDNPDKTISEMGEITRNMAELTSMLRANREPLKQIVRDLPATGPDLIKAAAAFPPFALPLPELLTAITDLELELGPEIQNALDATSELLRIASPHYKGIADILNPLPRFISGLNGEQPGALAGGLAKHINGHLFDLLTWRPPLFRIPTPNGLLACGAMNASLPGSCADIGGRPYAADVALVQYVLTEAQRR